ncbi:hypothetical protein M378DRAFT_168432 [Amanita muscaria Koide BX008]|uniref:Uncharacterized protein n=1 Tax=Amanita muscaria (strain Koide BX008) TaxID=946122 RepID=A0A0C2SBD9_AMAMK|nr:hypothetical protein M378DRAFT_168432 [Amanita muscaria Koide BX008]
MSCKRTQWTPYNSSKAIAAATSLTLSASFVRDPQYSGSLVRGSFRFRVEGSRLQEINENEHERTQVWKSSSVIEGFEGEVWTRRHIMDLGVRLTTLIHAVAVKLISPVVFSLHPTFVFV